MRRRKLFVGMSNTYSSESGGILQRECGWYSKESNQARPAVVSTAQGLSRHPMKARGNMKSSFFPIRQFMLRLSGSSSSSLHESRISLPYPRTCCGTTMTGTYHLEFEAQRQNVSGQRQSDRQLQKAQIDMVKSRFSGRPWTPCGKFSSRSARVLLRQGHCRHQSKRRSAFRFGEPKRQKGTNTIISLDDASTA